MIKDIAQYIKNKLNLTNPKTAIILGSGLSEFANLLENSTTLDYKDIPNFPQSTVEGHKGQFVKGFIDNKEILCLNGRFHLYEGYNPQIISMLICTLKEIGIERIIVTNAAGSLKENLAPGSLMIINDHIALGIKSPLVGANNPKYGPRFPSLNNAYSKELRQKCEIIALEENIKITQGVYTMMLGPMFETPAEVKALRILGGDAVGMSTVPEVIAANHCSIEILGISVITNYAAGLMDNVPSHNETLEEANKASSKLIKLVTAFIKKEC